MPDTVLSALQAWSHLILMRTSELGAVIIAFIQLKLGSRKLPKVSQPENSRIWSQSLWCQQPCLPSVLYCLQLCPVDLQCARYCPGEELFWWQVLTMNFCGIIKIFLPSSDWCLPFPPPPYFLIEEECPKYLLVVISSILRGQHLITLAFVFTKKVITLLPFMSH